MGLLSNMFRFDDAGHAIDDYLIQPALGEYQPASISTFTNEALPSIDPALYELMDASASSSARLVGDIANLHANNPFLGSQDDAELWTEVRRNADKDRQDTGRWAENTAATAGAVLAGIYGGSPAWAGGAAGGLGAAAQGGDYGDIARGWARGTYSGSIGHGVGELGEFYGLSPQTSSALGQAASGATSSSLAGQDADHVLGAGVRSGLGGYTPDVASGLGVTDPNLSRSINMGTRGLVSSSLNGNPSTQTGINTTMAALPGLYDYYTSPDNNNGGQYSTAPWMSDSPLTQQSRAPWASEAPSGITPTSLPASSLPGKQESSSLDSLGSFLQGLMPTSGERLGGSLSNLMGLYSGYRRYKDARTLARSVNGNREAYITNLRNSMMARDAMRGRRSNIGGREVELQGKLAELDSRNIPVTMQANASRWGAMDNILRSGYGLGNSLGYWGAQPTHGIYNTPRVPSPLSSLYMSPQAPMIPRQQEPLPQLPEIPNSPTYYPPDYMGR